jgi:hypothetical protein
MDLLISIRRLTIPWLTKHGPVDWNTYKVLKPYRLSNAHIVCSTHILLYNGNADKSLSYHSVDDKFFKNSGFISPNL